jgi:hypothetical protein
MSGRFAMIYYKGIEVAPTPTHQNGRGIEERSTKYIEPHSKPAEGTCGIRSHYVSYNSGIERKGNVDKLLRKNCCRVEKIDENIKKGCKNA